MCAGHVNQKHCIFATLSVTDKKGKWVISGSEDHSIYIWHLNGRHVSPHVHVPLPMLTSLRVPESVCVDMEFCKAPLSQNAELVCRLHIVT